VRDQTVPDQTVPDQTVRDQLAALGPFFAAETHDPDSALIAPWRAMSELAVDRAVLADRVHAARVLLASGGGQPVEAVELRVAASVVQLGLVARIASPLLALGVLEDRTTPVALSDLRWQPEPGSTFPLSIAHAATHTQASSTGATPEALAHALGKALIDHVITELCKAFRPFGVSPRVLWGNVASALNGACTVLAAARPEYAPHVRAVFNELLCHPLLAGTAQTGPSGRFQRRSCCLIYRAAPGRAGALCGDCVLVRRSGSARGSRPPAR
jgi:ferric iron reductase protein FhuF